MGPCDWPFCLENVAHWANRCPQPFQNSLKVLGYVVGCCCQPHAWFASLVGWRCAETVLRNQPSLHHGWCNVSFFFYLWNMRSRIIHRVVCVIFLRRCLILWYKIPDLVILNIGWCGLWKKMHSHIGCYKSLDGVSITNQVTGCWISLFGLYQIWFEHPVRSPVLLVYVTT